MSWAGEQVDRFDRLVTRMTSRKRVVLVDARTAMNFAILAPVSERLQLDPRIRVLFSAPKPQDSRAAAAASGLRAPIESRRTMLWRRVDLCLTADPWDPVELRRCDRRAIFSHGVAGKYDLDEPANLPISFEMYDRVAFINADRMQRYLVAGIVRRESAVLVGYPKVDALVNGRFDAAAVRSRLGLEMHRLTALYAPTWSPASSLNLAGEAIVESLLAGGFNVIIKLHDRSLDPTEMRFSGGIDWRARFARLHHPGRVAFIEADDSSPLLAASDVMVTDHSSVGFEFLLLDRPLIVFDTPDLPRVARIRPDRIALLRSAARVVRDASEVGTVALAELRDRGRLSVARHAAVRDMFHKPGTATERAMAMVYELLGLPAGEAHSVEAPLPAEASV